jgi:triosephosphate isomerase
MEIVKGKPVIIVNFKAYENASGQRALELAKIHEKVAKKTGVSFAIAVQPIDLRMVAAAVDIPVLAQHFDPVEFGPFTGHVLPHVLKEAGAVGSLLNHAERKLPLDVIEKSVELARSVGFFTVLCADTAYAGKALSEFDPDLIAVEPPELIGGCVSVATANPQLISDVVNMVGSEKVLVGAGIKTKQDVHRSLDLGAMGVLLASGVTKSLNPEEVLMDLAQGVLDFKMHKKDSHDFESYCE